MVIESIMVWKNYLLTYDHIMDVLVNYNFENKLCVVHSPSRAAAHPLGALFNYNFN